MLKFTSQLACALSALAFTVNSFATTVQFQTSHGDFEVILFDEKTPKTVENFLQYVNEEAYEDSVIHRSVKNFVIQGGGFNLTENVTLNPVTTHPQVTNEAYYSNIRATISMAKRGGQPNSATSQWFFNLGNNSANLDYANGGYTVFGQVIGDGMATIDAIAALSIEDVDAETGGTGIGKEVPLQDYDESSQSKPSSDNFVTIYNVIVTDAAVNNAGELEVQPRKIEPRAAAPLPTPTKSGGAINTAWFIQLLMFMAAATALRSKKPKPSH